MDMLDHKNVTTNEIKELNSNEIRQIDGGSLSGTLINAITSGMKVVLDIGRSLGSAIRRVKEDNMCAL